MIGDTVEQVFVFRKRFAALSTVGINSAQY